MNKWKYSTEIEKGMSVDLKKITEVLFTWVLPENIKFSEFFRQVFSRTTNREGFLIVIRNVIGTFTYILSSR